MEVGLEFRCRWKVLAAAERSWIADEVRVSNSFNPFLYLVTVSKSTVKHQDAITCRKVMNLEESTILHYIHDLDARAFSPRDQVFGEDAAEHNRLLRDREAKHVGQRWASRTAIRSPDALLSKI